jgi:hypothetical protein
MQKRRVNKQVAEFQAASPQRSDGATDFAVELFALHTVGLLAEPRGTHGYSWATLRVEFNDPMENLFT